MNRREGWLWPFFAVFLLCLFLLPVRSWAQDDSVAPENDPPARVARMNFTQGSVSFQPGGEGDWVDAVPNRPLTTGDNLWADKDSRAELHVGSTSIRIGSETSLTFLELDDRVLQLRLAQGSALVRVHHFDDGDTVEIDTPNLAFLLQRTGEYRVDVQPDGRTAIVDVYQGRGEAIGGGNNYTIVANQSASFTGDQGQGDQVQPLNYDIDPLPAPDDFDRWAFDRDRREDQSITANYVSPEMTGYEDLDDNGRWSYAGSYGPVWYPNVAVGWAPYRYGHWVWVAPWGWTWVDDAPWGFAPFHYGRWCLIGGGWAWVPGPVAVHPVYAPALVAFVGGPGGFQFSAFGGGVGVAWFPLGPGEVFVPAYHVSPAYVTQVNITNTVVNVTKVTNVYNTYTATNINNTTLNRITYVNQTAAVTAVSRDTFVNARPVARNVVAVPAREIAQAPINHMSGVEPVRGSVMGAGKPTTVAPPRAVVNRQVVAQHAPSQPPTPFAQRQDKLLVRPVAPVKQTVTQPANTKAAPAPVERSIQEAPRPEVPRPGAQTQPARAAEPYSNSGARPQTGAPPISQPSEQQGWSHPQARPAPPVQPKSESQARDEETKYRNWQAKPQPAKPAPEKSAPQKDDKKK